MSGETEYPFEFTPIEGYLNLEHATAELVHIAELIQDTHTFDSTRFSKTYMMQLFELRKKGMLSLLDLIEEYIKQMPG